MAYVKQINVSNTAYDIRAKALGAAQLGSATRGIYLTSTGEPAVVGWYPVYCTIDGGNKANYPWHRFATCTTTTGQYQDYDAIIILRSRYHGGAFGIVKAMIRTNSTNSGMNMDVVWLYRYGFAVNDICMSPNAGTSGHSVTFNLYVKCPTYPRRIAYLMEGSNKGWSLINSAEANDTTATDPKTSYEVFANGGIPNYKYAIDNEGSAWVLKSGDTMSGNLHVVNTANNTAGLAINIQTQSYSFGLHMGTGGTNHGIYDWSTPEGWMIVRGSGNNIWTSFNADTSSASIRNIAYGTTAPSNSWGENGQVYIRYTA